MSVRTTPWPFAAVALTAIVAAVGLAAPAPASAAAPAHGACPGGPLSVRTLQGGCAATSGSVRLPDGRTFTLPAPGGSVAASSVAVPGAEELPALMLCAHIDSSSDAPAMGVRPHVVREGGERGPFPARAVAELLLYAREDLHCFSRFPCRSRPPRWHVYHLVCGRVKFVSGGRVVV